MGKGQIPFHWMLIQEKIHYLKKKKKTLASNYPH